MVDATLAASLAVEEGGPPPAISPQALSGLSPCSISPSYICEIFKLLMPAKCCADQCECIGLGKDDGPRSWSRQFHCSRQAGDCFILVFAVRSNRCVVDSLSLFLLNLHHFFTHFLRKAINFTMFVALMSMMSAGVHSSAIVPAFHSAEWESARASVPARVASVDARNFSFKQTHFTQYKRRGFHYCFQKMIVYRYQEHVMMKLYMYCVKQAGRCFYFISIQYA